MRKTTTKLQRLQAPIQKAQRSVKDADKKMTAAKDLLTGTGDVFTVYFKDESQRNQFLELTNTLGILAGDNFINGMQFAWVLADLVQTPEGVDRLKELYTTMDTADSEVPIPKPFTQTYKIFDEEAEVIPNALKPSRRKKTVEYEDLSAFMAANTTQATEEEMRGQYGIHQ
jgi:hypothetical protein